MSNILQPFNDLQKVKVKRSYKLVKLLKNGKIEYLRKVNDQEKIGFVCECELENTIGKNNYYSLVYYNGNEIQNIGNQTPNEEIELREIEIIVPVEAKLNQSTSSNSLFSDFAIISPMNVYIKPVSVEGFYIEFRNNYNVLILSNVIDLYIPTLANYSASTFEFSVPIELYLDNSYTKKLLSQTINITLLFNSEIPEGD